MADMIKFLRGNVASLPATATPGAVYFTKDEGLYLGLEDGTYHRYGDFITVADVASLPEDGAHETCMYYCVSENVLAKWSGTTWIQINKQKTLAELGGVAKSVYEAKMAALEKADTDNATAISGVDTRLQAAEKKLESVATTEGLAELTNRVGVAETDIDNLQAAIAEGGSVANAIAEAKKAGTDAAELAGTKTTMAEVEAKNYATKEEAQGYANAKDEAIGAAQARADEAYNLANGKATMDQVNAAIAGAGHAVKADVDTAIENLGKAYVAADEALETKLQGNIDKKVDQTAYDTKMTELAGADTTLQGNIDALAGKVGTPTEGKTIVQMIADAQTAATYDDTQVKADIKANADAIDAIEADYLKKADKDGLQEQITANANAITLLTNGASAEEVDGVNDLINYVKEHGTEVTGMKADIAANAKAIADQATSDAATYETKTDAAQKLTDANAYTDAEVAKLAKVDTDNLQAAKDYADDAVEALKIGEYIKKVDADAAYATAGHDHDDKYDAIGAAEAAQSAAEAYADSLATNYDEAGAAYTAEQNAKDYADDLAVNYDAAGAADTAEQHAKDYADGLAVNYDEAGAAEAAKEAAIADAAEKYETKGTAQGIVDGLKLSETYEPIGAEGRAIAAAKTETENQVKALAGEGNTSTVKKNADDIASLFEQFQWGEF